jgi:AcrR family transcriptional regulator
MNCHLAESDNVPVAQPSLAQHPATGLTARRKERTRQQLAEAAAALFYERGYEHTTIEDIAAAVEVSPRTVYRYFATKEELVVALGQANSALFLAALRDRPSDEPLFAAVRAAVAAALAPKWQEAWRVRAFLMLIRDNPVLRARWVLEAYDDQRQMAEVIAGRLGRRCRLADMVVAGAIAMAINTALAQWAEQEQVATPERFVDRALTQLTEPLLPRDSVRS